MLARFRKVVRESPPVLLAMGFLTKPSFSSLGWAIRSFLDLDPTFPDRGKVARLNFAIDRRIKREAARHKKGVVAAGRDPQPLNSVGLTAIQLYREAATDPDVMVMAAHNPEYLNTLLAERAAASRSDLEEYYQNRHDAIIRFASENLKELARYFPTYKTGMDNAAYQDHKRIEAIEATQGKVLEKQDRILEQLGNEKQATVGQGLPTLRSFGSEPDTYRYAFKPAGLEQIGNLVADGANHRIVLTGMCGIGKTQCAVLFAQQCRNEEWDLVAWIDASSTKNLTHELARLGHSLGLESEQSATEADLAQQCLEALSRDGGARRLIVLDGVNQIGDVEGLPFADAGFTVLATTTNAHGWRDGDWETVEIDTVDPDTATQYLLDHTGLQDREGAAKLAESVGYLPLALTHAATYIRDSGIGFDEFLKDFNSVPMEESLARTEGEIYRMSVSETMQNSAQQVFDRIGPEKTKIAQQQLGALAALPTSGLPRHLLETIGNNKIEARDTLNSLAQNRLCRISEDGTVSLHPLRAKHVRETSNQPDNVRTAASILESVRNHDPNTARALAQTLHQLNKQGDHERATRLHPLVDALSNTVGPGHKATLVVRNNLAKAYQGAGRSSEAIALFEQNLAYCNQTLGSSHHYTHSVRNDLIRAYRTAGRTNDADKLAKRASAKTNRPKGVNHPTAARGLTSAGTHHPTSRPQTNQGISR